MLYPDPDTRLQLARERQADLQREALVASLARPAVVESAMRRRRLQVRRLRIRLRPAGHLSWR